MIILFSIAAVFGFFMLWRFFIFFRNPKRNININRDHILAPADGFIVYIKEISTSSKKPIFSIKGKHVIKLTDLMNLKNNALNDTDGILIGIFMSPFDVHYNRSPIEGKINKIQHEFPQGETHQKKNQSMFNTLSNLIFNEKPFTHDSEYIISNERASYLITNDRLSVYVTQIADQWVNKIVTYIDNEFIEQGEIFGLIRMGSQVDIFIPDINISQVVVSERQHVVAGKTILINQKTMQLD